MALRRPGLRAPVTSGFVAGSPDDMIARTCHAPSPALLDAWIVRASSSARSSASGRRVAETGSWRAVAETARLDLCQPRTHWRCCCRTALDGSYINQLSGSLKTDRREIAAGCRFTARMRPAHLFISTCFIWHFMKNMCDHPRPLTLVAYRQHSCCRYGVALHRRPASHLR